MTARSRRGRLRRVIHALGLACVLLLAALALHLALEPDNTVFSGKRPQNLGATDGRLAPCRKTPNCVSSQAPAADAEHSIAPIAFAGNAPEAMAAARAALAQVRGARVIREEGSYLYAEVRSRLLGFVDDVELLFDAPSGAFQVRSASRLGRRDYGVNRARVETLRRLISAAQRR